MALADGTVDVSVKRYPVTPTLSVAVNDRIGIVKAPAVAGTVKAVTIGRVVSAAAANGIVAVVTARAPILKAIANQVFNHPDRRLRCKWADR